MDRAEKGAVQDVNWEEMADKGWHRLAFYYIKSKKTGRDIEYNLKGVMTFLLDVNTPYSPDVTRE